MASVLVVEDELINAQIITMTVQDVLGAECQVLKAVSSHQAIEMVREQPDLITLDFNLADNTTAHNFIGPFVEMLKDGTLRDIPIILVSSEPLADLELMRDHCASIREIVRKPFKMEKLEEAMRRCLGMSES